MGARSSRVGRSTGLLGLALSLSLLAGCGSTVPASSVNQQTSGLGPDSQQNSLGNGPTAATGQSGPSGDAILPTASAGGGGTSGSAGATSGRALPVGVPPTTALSHAPILVGVVVTDTSTYPNPAGDASKTSPAMMTRNIHAYLDEINRKGGIAGRQLKALDVSPKFTAANYSTEFQAACSALTQDHHADVVIYDGIVYNDTFNTCLTRAGIPEFVMVGSGGSSTGDAQDFRSNPGLVAVDTPSIDRRVRSVMTKAIAGGYLSSKNKLGVMLEDCPYDTRTFDKVVAPIAAQHHITTFREDLVCESGFGDEGTNSSLLSSAVIKMRSEGVDTVIFVTLYENGLIYFFDKEADSQNWWPQTLTYVPQAGPDYMALFSQASLAVMRGFGGNPFLDVTYPAAPTQSLAAARAGCLAVLKAHNIPATDFVGKYLAFETCDAVRLMQESLVAAGGRTGLPVIMRGLESVGNSFVSTFTYDGVTHFGATRHDGLELTRVSVYKTRCSCFEYVGPASPIG
jgi:ABC-type branched-subunit amino acid transport system substrate-binding protein